MNSLLIKELKNNTKINISEVTSNNDTFLNDNHYYFYLKYNIFKLLKDKNYLYFNDALFYIEKSNKNELNQYLKSNVYHLFHQKFNKINKINYKLPYSFEHYIIYYLFDWEEINKLK